MSNEHSRDSLGLSPEQLLALGASARTLQVLRDMTKPLPNEEGHHGCSPILGSDWRKGYYSALIEPGVVSITAYGFYGHEEAAPLIKRQPNLPPAYEAYSGLLVNYAGTISIRDAFDTSISSLTMHELYELDDDQPELNGGAVIIRTIEDIHETARIIGDEDALAERADSADNQLIMWGHSFKVRAKAVLDRPAADALTQLLQSADVS